MHGVHNIYFFKMVQKADIKKAISISRHDSSWTPSSMPIVNNGDSYIPPWVAGSSGPSGSGSTSFSFQKEKQQILRTIAETSQAAINLNNALKVFINSVDVVNSLPIQLNLSWSIWNEHPCKQMSKFKHVGIKHPKCVRKLWVT